MSVLLAVLAVGPVLGCGSSGNDEPPPQPEPTAAPADFPVAAGKTVPQLWAIAQQDGPVMAPSVSVLHKGTNRFGFALFDTARKQITGAQVAVYTAAPDGSALKGPYVARAESLEVEPPYQSETAKSDPDGAKSVYVADVPFDATGTHAVTALARLDGRMVRTNAFPVEVSGRSGGPPDVGQKAVKVHTPTLAEVGGDASQIDTRRPAAKELLRDDLADVLGKRPVVLTFATPLLCESRVCGPVVDVVEQVRAKTSKDVAFIHVEVYNDNEVAKGYRQQLIDWRLRTEPWTFVIDRGGRVSARFEGAFSPGELERAVDKVA